MKVIGLSMSYNEQDLIYKSLQHAYPYCDRIVAFEGTVSPFDDQPAHSQDNTIDEIMRFKAEESSNKLITWFPDKNNSIAKREHYEGWVKNKMLEMTEIENGDLIWMIDTDEFWRPEGLDKITEAFKKDDSLLHLPMEEYQFAYNTSLYFNAGHDGRFMRYLKGAQYTASQHLIHDGQDISRLNKENRMKREDSQMFHLCWVKHPELIKQKVLTFKRGSFTRWYNDCYLVWPFDFQKAYDNNTQLSRFMGWPGGGFAEGQTEPLQKFKGQLPKELQDMKDNWLPYIKNNHKALKV